MDESLYLRIKQYKNGQLTEAERMAFEQQMQTDPAFAEEVATWAAIFQGIQEKGDAQLNNELMDFGKQLLQTSAAAPEMTAKVNPELMTRRAFWRNITMILTALTLFVGAVYLIFRKKETAVPVPTQQPQEQRTTPPPTNNPTTPVDKQGDNKISEPMAQLRPDERLARPRYAAPEAILIRGDEDVNKAQKALLDQLWYTDYPLKGLNVSNPFAKTDESLKKRDFNAAYLALGQLASAQPNNDTLRYLQGYCLLEMAEGEEALTYFDALQGRHAAWEPQLQWYRGLAMLLTNEQVKALAVFKKMAANPKHLYFKEAVKAVDLMTKRK